VRVCFLLLLLIPVLALGQSSNENTLASSKIEYYLNLFSQADNSKEVSTRQISGLAEKLEQKRSSFSHQKDFVEYVFRKTHQRFLKHYDDYVSFSEMLDNRSYNCLTGTALYALLLDHFGISYKVIETNYHIFLIANTDEGRVLLEATDPMNGFVSDAGAIEGRIRMYRQNAVQEVKSSMTYYKYNFNLYHEVNLDEMLGLLHYNFAVEAFNQNRLQESVYQLSKAVELYNSPRIEEFSRIVLFSVKESNLDPSAKARCIKDIQSWRKKTFVATASTH
jgi:hypothetical protein